MAVVDKFEFAPHITGMRAPENGNTGGSISRMSSSELLRFGVSIKFRYSEGASPDEPETADLAAQLSEARTEWKRRHPELPLCDSF